MEIEVGLTVLECHVQDLELYSVEHEGKSLRAF